MSSTPPSINEHFHSTLFIEVSWMMLSCCLLEVIGKTYFLLFMAESGITAVNPAASDEGTSSDESTAPNPPKIYIF